MDIIQSLARGLLLFFVVKIALAHPRPLAPQQSSFCARGKESLRSRFLEFLAGRAPFRSPTHHSRFGDGAAGVVCKPKIILERANWFPTDSAFRRSWLHFLVVMFLCPQLISQTPELTVQELEVIKTYQFDIAIATPVQFDLAVPELQTDLSKKELKIDLLPIQLEEISYQIKPLAHIPQKSKYYNGYLNAHYGNKENMDINVSFRRMVPNYFIYGIEGEFYKINDSEVLDKNLSTVRGSTFLRYFLSQKTWLQLSGKYAHLSAGVYGFNTAETISSTGEENRLDIRKLNNAVDLHHQLNNKDLFLNYELEINKTSNRTSSINEVLLRNNLNIGNQFSNGLSLNINISNEHLAKSLPSQSHRSLSQGRLTAIYMKKGLGIKAEAKAAYFKNAWQIDPNAELFFKSENHKVEWHYRTSYDLFTYDQGLNSIYFINMENLNSEITETQSIGGSYEYQKRSSHSFQIGANYLDLTNGLIWRHNPVNKQFFDPDFLDYSYYLFEVRHLFYFLRSLSFSQEFNYRLLDKIEKSALPHTQDYTLESSLTYSVGKFEFDLSYILGDQVHYTTGLDYSETSDYQHDIGFSVTYRPHEQLKIQAEGLDLLDNRFERFGGYADYGRRFRVGVFGKF